MKKEKKKTGRPADGIERIKKTMLIYDTVNDMVNAIMEVTQWSYSKSLNHLATVGVFYYHKNPLPVRKALNVE